MAERYIDRETLLDLTVNIIPLGILAFFFVLFIAVSPWGWDPLFTTLMLGLILWHALLLTLVTWVAGRKIAREERTGETQHPG